MYIGGWVVYGSVHCSGFLIHGYSSGVEYEDGSGNYNAHGDGDGSMFTVENELGEGRLEGLNSKEVQVIGLCGGKMISLSVVIVLDKEFKGNEPLIVHPIAVIEKQEVPHWSSEGVWKGEEFFPCSGAVVQGLWRANDGSILCYWSK